MLLYHFGSKDGLLAEVVRAVEARTQDRFAAISEGVGGDTDELVRRLWAYVADPALAGFERLFFALYGRALQGDRSALALLQQNDSRPGSTPTSRSTTGAGIPPAVARIHARLGLAVIRGLLLDLLATGDRAGIDAALEVFARRLRRARGGRLSRRGPGTSAPAPATAPRRGPGGREPP